MRAGSLLTTCACTGAWHCEGEWTACDRQGTLVAEFTIYHSADTVFQGLQMSLQEHTQLRAVAMGYHALVGLLSISRFSPSPSQPFPSSVSSPAAHQCNTRQPSPVISQPHGARYANPACGSRRLSSLMLQTACMFSMLYTSFATSAGPHMGEQDHANPAYYTCYTCCTRYYTYYYSCCVTSAGAHRGE
jgi:hypothetical protein